MSIHTISNFERLKKHFESGGRYSWYSKQNENKKKT